MARYSPASPVPWSDRLLLIEAAPCLGVARLSVLTLPFKWVIGALRQQQGDLGVAKDDNGNLAAHAWLRSGGVMLTGGASLERFCVIAAFRD